MTAVPGPPGKGGPEIQTVHVVKKVYIASMNKTGLFLWVLLASGPVSFSPAADAGSTQQSAYKGSIKQDEIKNSTGKVRGELLAVLREMQLNGLLDFKPENIRKAAAELGVVGEEQMQSVVEALKGASLNEDPAAQKRQIVEAYTTQTEITQRLDKLAMQFQRAQAKSELGKAARSLLERQMAVQRDTQALLAEKKPDAAKAQAAKAGQAALKSEAANLLQKIKDAEKILTPEEAAQLAQSRQVAEKAGLEEAADKASQNLSADQLAAAVKEQEKAKQALSKLVQSMDSHLPAMERLQNMVGELDKVIQEQKATAQEAAHETARPELKDKQQHLADKTEITKDQAGAINAKAASELDRARQQMEQAAQNMAPVADKTKTPDDGAAERQSRQAVENLEQARESLEKQMAALAKEQAPKDFKEALADLNQLQNKTMQALVDQTVAERSTPDTAAQKNMSDRLAGLQQEAVPLAPDAAEHVGDAVENLNKSAPQAAVKPSEDLQKALDAVQAKIAQTKQDAAAAAALAQMNESLQAAMESSQGADKAMQQSGQQPAANMAQQAATQAQAAAAQAQQAGSQQAQQAAQAAGQSFQQASQAAQQGNMKAAQAANQAGQKALAQAQQAAQQAGMQQSQQLAMMSGKKLPEAPESGGQDSYGYGDAAPPAANSGVMGFGSRNSGGPAQTMGGLNPKDREALALSEQERTLPEFAPMVQQYRKNLANAVNP